MSRMHRNEAGQDLNGTKQRAFPIAFGRIAEAARPYAEILCRRWLPDGHRETNEWVARNPRRIDHRLGSFKINLTTARWGDFATGDTGGDMISLAAYLFNLTQRNAALETAEMLGIDPYER